MKAPPPIKFALAALVAMLLAGCASTRRPLPDYTNFRQYQPRSILVLPPVNHAAGEGTYNYLSTVSRPIAEFGYYVFPVAVVDHLLKESGFSSASEMHQMPLTQIRELTGADAVLFLTLEKYGSRYTLDNYATAVMVRGTLVDTQSGVTLWEGSGSAYADSTTEPTYNSDQSVLENLLGQIFADLVSAALDNAIYGRSDRAHDLCDEVNDTLFTTRKHGLLYGPYHPKYGKDPK